MRVRESYDSAASVYAEHLASELEHKPLDRQLLNRFAEAMHGRGLVADLGCGPGHVAKYLYDLGVHMIGIDLSPEMVRCARRLHPTIDFRVGDMTALDFADGVGGLGARMLFHLMHELPARFVGRHAGQRFQFRARSRGQPIDLARVTLHGARALLELAIALV